MMARLITILALGWAMSCASLAGPEQSPLLEKVGTIALPKTSGRVDHLAIDRARGRLFVAEIGNDSVDVIDLAKSKVIHRISGLDEPQGVAYAAKSDRLVVSNGGDATVRIFDGSDYALRGKIKLDDDADDARLDEATGHAVIGHGTGGVAIIDPDKVAWLKDIPLPAHPEGFAVSGRRAFINLPDAEEIDVADLDSGKVIATWKPLPASSNYPMALDTGGHAAVVFRGQSKFMLFDSQSGKVISGIATCSDADDIYFDAARRRFMVSCGAGVIDLIAEEGTVLRELGRVQTSWGARTSLFVPELDRLFVAERAGLLGSNAAIGVFRPTDPLHKQ